MRRMRRQDSKDNTVIIAYIDEQLVDVARMAIHDQQSPS